HPPTHRPKSDTVLPLPSPPAHGAMSVVRTILHSAIVHSESIEEPEGQQQIGRRGMIQRVMNRSDGLAAVGFALLFNAVGCSSAAVPASINNHDSIQSSASTIESLRLFAAIDGNPGSITPHEANSIAIAALEDAGRSTAIWSEPSFVVGDCYFFTFKRKTGYALAGVLVHADSGETAIVDGDLVVHP
ncbi:MAG: hypothetical protein ACTS3F_05230, partial [Phycisphaerales bacterium]